MGWWQIDAAGQNRGTGATGRVWGDTVADIFDEALDRIVDEYRQEWGRRPTADELHAGLKFSMEARDDD